MNLALLVLLAAAPAAPPAAWKPLIGEYGAPPNIVYILEKDGDLIEFSEKTGPVKLDPKELHVGKDPKGLVTEVTIGAATLPRHRLPSEDGSTFRIKPVRPVPELREEAMKATPPPEEGEFRSYDLVELKYLSPNIHLDIRYATTNNFMSTAFYSQPRAFMQRPAAEALAHALDELSADGYGLLIHDAYRPWYVTKMFWEAVPPEDKIFVADPEKGSRHNRGCAVDLTLYELKTGKSVEMTGGYDEMSDRSFPNFPGGTTRQRWHRDLLRRAMEANGFTVNESEWWHFDYKDWAKYPILNISFERLSPR
jgi:D-alanyl-D-alanine dipeptidase